tara:strand:- start:67402 stop:67575 length:174 start_codon:yes stop_codon:yes gene_type:complete
MQLDIIIDDLRSAQSQATHLIQCGHLTTYRNSLRIGITHYTWREMDYCLVYQIVLEQ